MSDKCSCGHAHSPDDFCIYCPCPESAIRDAESILNTGVVVYGKGFDPHPVGARIVVQAVECVR